jgi:hypothetical protein
MLLKRNGRVTYHLFALCYKWGLVDGDCRFFKIYKLNKNKRIKNEMEKNCDSGMVEAKKLQIV